MTNAIKRRVFYSFHFLNDVWRAGQVRNIGAVEGNAPVSHNEWEDVKKGGNAAIEKWIDQQLVGRTCTIVLVGAETASRPWVRHEIAQSWNKGIAVMGVRVNKLLNSQGQASYAGDNPFDKLTLKNGARLSTLVRLYEPAGATSQAAYSTIANNLTAWIEAAIKSR
ncbi:TIR domain-containing protein [Rhizobacter sp. SG703]|uniref:TIR domain-containing protein n=1 Tax=Rhizobacter sp. SG703 TaxID=2587140 RepID=UPI0018448BC3|nr:TIR domain-containing protein [Rhizobacter sp. SG703]NKI97534.1 hypothetical protein [Rhizobacter sp. SG703]